MDRNTWIGLIAAALCLAFVFLTQEAGGSAVETLEKETMAIHDEAMKEMAGMNRIGRTLKQEMESLDSLAPRRAVIREVLGVMEQAEEDMYTWMQQYTPPGELPAAEAEKFLTEQKRKIEKNYQDMLAASAAGKKLLSE